jgi:AcrR family transcriptional regulator
MGISERKTRAKEELRQTIIEAAMKIFVQEGYEKTSIRNIADSIEYSPGTIYLHFKDKDELLFAVHEEAFIKFFELMAPVLLISDTRERLLQMGKIYIQFAFENPELYGLMFMDKAPMNCLQQDDGAWICGQKVHNLLRDTMAEVGKKEGLTEYEIDAYTLSIWSYVHGLTSLAIRDRFCMIQEKNYELDDVIQKSLEIMLNKLLPTTN